ncbi:MAG: hypothetical protein H7069_06815, partial [Phormidesmis sp. FL-bin-119]|nr:hypothetical protein [Pedobacter sp.]
MADYKKKLALIFLALTMFQALGFAQNKLDLSSWTVGSGTTGVFTQNGQSSENTREWGEGPNAKRVVLWKASPEGSSNDDGGYNSAFFPISHGSLYRFSIWLKKTNSSDGHSYFGCDNVSGLDGIPYNNPYFWYGDLPELNKWYLLVGYIHGSGDNSTVSYGGIYDGQTGLKVVSMTDYKFATTTTHSTSRAYLYYDPNTADRQFFYAPRVDLVNGDEPPLSALLALEGSSSDKTYFAGKVGIKTPDPGNYELAVNGKVRAKEIKVENSNWPDYVFSNSYRLAKLDDTRKFIALNGHLPDVPSAREVEKEGFNISQMNAILLKKIEELTLHLIEKEKQLKGQNARI